MAENGPNTQHTSTRYCFIVRHGERADHAPETADEYRGHPDAHLTPRGHKQAVETGQFLSSELSRIEAEEGRSFDEILVKCSPFVRCMATTARICKQINIESVSIDYNYCEWLADFLYSDNPVPHLSIRNKDSVTLNTEFNLQDISFTDNDEGFQMANTLYVEDQESGRKRLAANIMRQKE